MLCEEREGAGGGPQAAQWDGWLAGGDTQVGNVKVWWKMSPAQIWMIEFLCLLCCNDVLMSERKCQAGYWML